MTMRLLCIALLSSLFLSSGSRQIRRNMSGEMMTEGQALSALRVRYSGSPNAGFVVALKIQATEETQKMSEESLAEARSKGLPIYQNGLFVNLLRAGGYVILEFDNKTEAVKRLYVVTSDTAGASVVQSSDVHGDLTRNEALTIIERSANFSKAFFDSPDSQIKELLIKFGGPEAATSGIPDGKGYFAIPETVRRLTTEPQELFELTSLSNGLALWTIRHAPAAPVYAANPVAAVRQANKELSRLAGEFRANLGEKGNLDFVDHLVDLSSIHTSDELMARLQLLKKFSSFLDERSPLPVQSPGYRANVSVSSVPLDLLVEQDAGQLYGATTAPGLVTVWRHDKRGELILVGLSVAE